MENVSAILAQASDGLLMPSESEYPFSALLWEDISWESLDSMLLQKLGLPEETSVEKVTLDYLFRNIAEEQEWHDDMQRAEVPRFAALKESLEQHLTTVEVYRVGTIEIDVYILGKTAAGKVAGLQTKVIET